jgi:hypothetical protein
MSPIRVARHRGGRLIGSGRSLWRRRRSPTCSRPPGRAGDWLKSTRRLAASGDPLGRRRASRRRCRIPKGCCRTPRPPARGTGPDQAPASASALETKGGQGQVRRGAQLTAAMRLRGTSSRARGRSATICDADATHRPTFFRSSYTGSGKQSLCELCSHDRSPAPLPQRLHNGRCSLCSRAHSRTVRSLP